MDTNLFVKYQDKLLENCGKVILGKEDVIRRIGVCLIASGHVLLEDLPGTGKTMLLRAYAYSSRRTFCRRISRESISTTRRMASSNSAAGRCSPT